MGLIITKSPVSSFPTITGDLYEELTEEEKESYIFSVYENDEFEIDISFSYIDDEFMTPLSVISSTCNTDLSEFGVTITKINDETFKVKGAYSNVITGEYYKFVMRNGEIKELDPNTSEDYRAVIEYSMPSVVYDTKTIDWTLRFGLLPAPPGSGLEVSVTMTQYIYWAFSSAAQTLTDLVKSRN